VPFSNGLVEIHLGNVESTMRGPVPHEALDRALNPHLQRGPLDHDRGIVASAMPAGAAVYDAPRAAFLSGALPQVKRVLRACGLRLRVRDHRRVRRVRRPLEVHGPPLRDYQEEVVLAALARERGLIDVGTGGGKTLLAATVVARLGLPALFVVTTRALLAQTRRSLERYLGLEPGVFGDGRKRPAPISVALAQSLRAGVDLEPWNGATLVFDEGHHAAASSYVDLVRRIAPRHAYYLSAVPFRSGPDQVVLDALAGERLTRGRYAARYLIDHGYACPIEVRLERCEIRGEMAERPFDELYDEFIVENDARNARIVNVALEEIAASRSVLVLVDRVAHAVRLAQRIGDGACAVHGRVARGALHAAIESFESGALRCLVATSALLSEGVSIARIEALVHAGGLKSRAKLIQAIGRGVRRAPGKRACTYVDFWDDDEAGVLREHSRQRLAVLRAEGFTVPDAPPPPDPTRFDDPIPPSWVHVPRSKRFLLVDADGGLRARGECIDRRPVPDTICKRCIDPGVCAGGGRISWLEEPDSTPSPSPNSAAGCARSARDGETPTPPSAASRCL
jgi:superfamily II DNA or RNA helicase